MPRLVRTRWNNVPAGNRVEIGPHYDLWMRGARYGLVKRWRNIPTPNGEIRLQWQLLMDHPQVRGLVTVWADDCTIII
jgi:hypothetical protein